jgi:hypothetical protein
MDQNELSFHPRHRGGPLGAAKKFPCPWYIRRKPCSYLAPRFTPFRADQTELPLDPRHLGLPLGAPKMISEPIACLTQMGYLSCVEISTISKETKTSFHLSHVTKEFNWVCPKGFPSLFHVQCNNASILHVD